MKIINQFFAFCLFATLSVTALAGDLTQTQIDSLINRLDVASNNFDVDALAKELSDDIKITINLRHQGQIQVLQLSKTEYFSLLKEGWKQISNYQSSRSHVKTVLQGSRATISFDMTETMDLNGQHIVSESSGTIIVELINDNALITSLVGDTKL